MKQKQTYTRAEIDSNINILKNQEENLLLTRKALNQSIREKRKNITYWQEMDVSQLKAF
ncbi:MAG: prefoldin subunit 5 [Polaribacter sp.]|jgi:prefoldin subunit 5